MFIPLCKIQVQINQPLDNPKGIPDKKKRNEWNTTNQVFRNILSDRTISFTFLQKYISTVLCAIHDQGSKSVGDHIGGLL